METTKFINNDIACMAATAAFMAVAHTGHYAVLSGGQDVGQYSIDVHLEIDELYTLPTGYLYSGVEEKVYKNPIFDCPTFKNKRYYFKF